MSGAGVGRVWRRVIREGVYGKRNEGGRGFRDVEAWAGGESIELLFIKKGPSCLLLLFKNTISMDNTRKINVTDSTEKSPNPTNVTFASRPIFLQIQYILSTSLSLSYCPSVCFHYSEQRYCCE